MRCSVLAPGFPIERMTLHIPSSFAAPDRTAIARLMHDHPFATLVTPHVHDVAISHLPLLLVPNCEPHGMLLGHFARASAHWRVAAAHPSVAVFHGPHAYVSPAWYGAPSRGVPTWNYAAVHAHGTLELVEDPLEARSILETLVQRFESGRAAPWQFAMPARERDALIGAIVAFRLRIRHLEAKFKLSQNRTADDRARVIAALDAEDYPDARATADWMRRYADPNGHGGAG